MALVLPLGACSSVPSTPPSAEALRAVEHPSPSDEAWLDSVAPRAAAWYSDQESAMLSHGRTLSGDEMQLAKQVGVRTPERVVVVVQKEFPFPADPDLKRELTALGMGSAKAGGFTLGHVILIKPKYASKRWLLMHELAHVAQHERLGTEAFVRRYLLELRILGYAQSPLEMEANSLLRKGI